jgi:hypothetical protein
MQVHYSRSGQTERNMKRPYLAHYLSASFMYEITVKGIQIKYGIVGLTVPKFRRIHAGFSLRHGSLRVLRFSLLITIPPLLYIHLSPPHGVCDSPEQAAHYHTLVPKPVASC